MGLGGLKKQEMDKNISIDGFIEGANTHSLLKESKAKYIRQTFSLTQDISDQIDELLVRSRVARVNRSIIVKTAIQQLALLSEEQLNLAVLKTKDDEL